MDFNEYQRLAARTINSKLSLHEQRDHALLIIPAEAGEVCGIFQKGLQGHPISIEAVAKEIGDELWGLAELCTVLGLKLGDCASGNISKLKTRYPNGFTEFDSISRVDAEEDDGK